MTRYFAWNRTKSVSGVHSSRTSVSRSGSAFLPCQSALKRRGAGTSQDDQDGNPSESGGSSIRTATAVRSWDVASYGDILANCPSALQYRRFEASPQNNHSPATYNKKLAVIVGIFLPPWLLCFLSGPCPTGLQTVCALPFQPDPGYDEPQC